MSPVFSTAAQPPVDRKAFWQEVVCKSFIPADIRFLDPGPFTGSVASDHVGAVHIGAASASPQHVARTERLISRYPEEHVVVALLTAGTGVISQRGKAAFLRPGDFVFFDTVRPYSADYSGQFGVACFMIPRPSFPLPTRVLEQVAGVRVPCDQGIGLLVSPFLTTLAAEAEAYANTPEVGSSAIELLAAAAKHVAGDESVAEQREAALLPGIRSFVEQRLSDPELRPEIIARAFGISVRYLHSLFADQDTTLGGWIRHRRLEACRRELGRSGSAKQTIAAVAHRWGFTDAAHFSRLFRASYGMSPREWRANATSDITRASGPAHS